MMSYGALARPPDRSVIIVGVAEGRLHAILRSLLHQVDVDELWYRERYSDVDDAIALGHLKSAREHYEQVGYFEDRFPRLIVVDEQWYLQTYPDVGEAIKAGRLSTAQEHFEAAGFREGRLPVKDWAL